MSESATKLDMIQATALMKLAEKRVEELKKAGEKIEPGTYSFDVSVSADGRLSRGDDTETTPQFRMESLYKAIILKYASSMDDPQQWIESLMAIDGALGAVVQLGSDAVLKTVDNDLIALHDRAVEQAKAKFKTVAKKQPKAGMTTVVGTVDVRDGVTA